LQVFTDYGDSFDPNLFNVYAGQIKCEWSGFRECHICWDWKKKEGISETELQKSKTKN
jgi:hypothetical protein